MFLTDRRPVTWDMFISKVERVEIATARNMRRKLNLPVTLGKHKHYSQSLAGIIILF